MSTFNLHSIDSAPESSRKILTNVEKGLGFLPNLMRVMAESPPTLEAYTTLMRLFEKSAFDTTEKEVILLAISRENGCVYCLAAHGKLAAMKGVPQQVIEAVRAGAPVADAKLQLLVDLTRSLVATRGWPDKSLLERFHAFGYTQRHYLELVLGVTLKTLSNYVNHAADTPIDEALAA